VLLFVNEDARALGVHHFRGLGHDHGQERVEVDDAGHRLRDVEERLELAVERLFPRLGAHRPSAAAVQASARARATARSRDVSIAKSAVKPASSKTSRTLSTIEQRTSVPPMGRTSLATRRRIRSPALLM